MSISTTVYAWRRLEVRNDLRGAFENMGEGEDIGPFEFTSEHCNQVTKIVQQFHDTRADWRRDERCPQWINWDLCVDLEESQRLKIQAALTKAFPKIRWWNWYGYKAITLISQAKSHNDILQP